MRTRIKPHHIAADALFAAASGIATGIAGFRDDSPITRVVADATFLKRSSTTVPPGLASGCSFLASFQ